MVLTDANGNISEAKVKKEMLEYIKGLEKQGIAFLIPFVESTTSRGGIPDIICCYRGIFCAFEVKKPIDSYGATERQKIIIRKIIKSGGIAEVVDNVENVKTIFQQIDKHFI